MQSKLIELVSGPLPEGFDPLAAPVWLWSLDGRRVLFASRAALVLSGVKSPESLTGQVFGDAIPATKRLAELGQSLAAHAPPRLERLRFFFKGRAEILTCLCKMAELKSGGAALLVAAFGVRVAAPDAMGEFAIAAQPPPLSGASPPQSAPKPQEMPPPADEAAAPVLGWLNQPSNGRRPVRFTWASDGQGRILSLSSQFAEATGLDASTFVGQTFVEILSACDAESREALKGLVNSRETWTAASVAWQVPGRRLIVPIDISGVPNFDLQRNFLGFRGFGVLRTDRARVLPPLRAVPPPEPPVPAFSKPEAAGAPAEPVPPRQPRAEAAIVLFPPRSAAPEAKPAPEDSKIAPLRKEPRESAPDHSQLSTAERQAFREIARALGARIEGEDAETAASAADIPAAEAPNKSSHLKAADAAPQLPGDAAAKPSPAAPPPDPAGDVQWKTADKPALPPANSNAAVMAEPAIRLPEQTAQELAARPAEPAPSPVTSLAGHSAEREALAKAKRLADTDALLDRLPVGALVLQGGRAVYANKTLLDLLGWPSLESLERDGGAKRILQGRAPDSLTSGSPAVVIQARDGEKIAVDAHVQTGAWRGAPSVTLAFRRAAEAEGGPKLRALELDLLAARAEVKETRAILDTATDGVIGLDERGRIIRLNRSAEALFGYNQNEVAGESLTALLSPESHATALDYLEGLRSHSVAALLNDGREVTGRERKGGRMPLFMTIGKLDGGSAGAFAAVLRDITQWKRSEAELLDAKRLAEKASAQKSDFLAKVSHEVRTPLNAIIGFAEVMMEERLGPVGNERYREYLRDIHVSGGHVMSLLNDLLDLSKIEAGKMELSFTSVDLNAVVASCLAIMQPQANQDRVVVRTHFAQKLPKVVADERSIRQIALNILSNASKFTNAGGQVIVSTALTDRGEAVLRIRDTGIGMSEKDIEAAMQPFRRLTTPSPKSGTGLGLPLTKALTEANRAHFSISSKPGEGTMVEISFPSTRVLAD